MMTTDLGACEWFVWDLRRSNLIDRGQLDQVIGEFLNKNPGAEPPALAEYLVGQGILTDFQAERLLQGKTQGFVLGPFTLMDALGTGSMGTVYKAQSKNDNGWYAVKVLPRRSMWNVRIARRKVRAFEQCQHPSVVPFVDVGTAGGMHYLAWPMVEGETVEKLVQREGKLPTEKAALFGLQTAEGLDICHQQGLFHGLLKPSNLMLGSDNVLRILDFGIGCLLAETEGESLVDTMSTANSVNSGLDCASPESIMDPTNLTAIGDQYSLGCVLYFCLSGQYPFPEGTAVEKMMSHQTKQPTPLKDLAPDTADELIAVIEKLMQKNPADRFANCQEAIEALRPFVASGPVVRRPSSQMPPRAPLPKPSGAMAAATAPRPPLRPAPLPRSANGTAPLPRSANGTAPLPRSANGTAPLPRSANGTAPLPRSASGTTQGPKSAPRPAPAPASKPDIDDDGVPQLPEPPTQEEKPVQPALAEPEGPSFMQRLGPVGIFLLAVMAGALAWLASSLIKF